MTDALSTARRHRLLILACMLAILVPVAFLAFPSTARAAQATPTCNPTATNGCVNGILQDSGKQPIAGVTVTLSGKESATTTTDASGKWAFSVTADGSYTVTIDKSVASSHGLPGNTETVSIDKSDFSKQRAVVRFDKANASPLPVRRPARHHQATPSRAVQVPPPTARRRQAHPAVPAISADVSGSSSIPA